MRPNSSLEVTSLVHQVWLPVWNSPHASQVLECTQLIRTSGQQDDPHVTCIHSILGSWIFLISFLHIVIERFLLERTLAKLKGKRYLWITTHVWASTDTHTSSFEVMILIWEISLAEFLRIMHGPTRSRTFRGQAVSLVVLSKKTLW